MEIECPCGSKQTYEDCCALFIEEGKVPVLPEQLMRARYTAHTKQRVDYIFNTMRDKALKKADRELSLQWLQKVEWIGLKILKVSLVGPGVVEGTVEFVARYREQGNEKVLHENSLFRKYGAIWYYVDRLPVELSPVTRHVVSGQAGRNDPCPCGSGKKYKRCCK